MKHHLNTVDRQQAILDYLRSYHKEHTYSPSYREIAAAIGVKSTNTVSYHITRLVNAGKLQRGRFGEARNLIVLVAEEQEAQPCSA